MREEAAHLIPAAEAPTGNHSGTSSKANQPNGRRKDEFHPPTSQIWGVRGRQRPLQASFSQGQIQCVCGAFLSFMKECE